MGIDLFFNLNYNFLFNFVLLFQFIFIYIFYSIYRATSIWYTVLYIFFQIIIFGLLLTFHSMDLFTAFLFLSESVVMFVSILLIFYLNVYGDNSKSLKSFNFFKFGFFFFLIFLNFFYVLFLEEEYFIFMSVETSLFYENFYGFLNHDLYNDLYSLYINYFYINNLSFLIVVFLLLVASLICVNLNILLKSNKILNYNNFFMLIDFFKDASKNIFMRKQSLIDQLNVSSVSRFFRKKDE